MIYFVETSQELMFQMMLYTVMNACMLDVVRKKGGTSCIWLVAVFLKSGGLTPSFYIYIPCNCVYSCI